jgi:hypothetical protein
MGAAQSSFDPRHVRIWNILSSIESTNARITQLETLFSAQEYVAAAKKAGLYGTLLQWMAAQRRGEYYPWPVAGNANAANTPSLAPRPIPVMTRTPSNALATIPPPKRALDALHDAYNVLGLDDSQTLTHERLRSAYKKKAAKAHPDKGGNAELFDKVTRAFLYVEEVLNKFVPKNATKSTPVQESRRIVNTKMENEIVLRNNVTDIAPVVAPMYSPNVPTKEVEKVALNPKKLDINLFNKMFEENRLPDPEMDEGYGSWLKSEETSYKASTSANASALRSKYNKDLFNQMFEEEARRNAPTSSGYNPPAEMVMSPGFGTELLGGKPNQYTNVMGAGGLGYTDLKYAYDEGNTFSQQVANVSLEGRPKTIEEAKAAYAKQPKPLTAEEVAANSAYENQRELMEQQRIQRLSDRDRQAEEFDKRLKERLTITK